jgi:ketosteroid isomerase-like protein
MSAQTHAGALAARLSAILARPGARRRALAAAALLVAAHAGGLAAQAVPGIQVDADGDRVRYRAEAMRSTTVMLGNWRNAWTRDDFAALEGFYLPNALLLFPGQETPAQGTAEVRAALEARLRTLGRVELQPVDASVGDDLLYLYQRYAVAADPGSDGLSDQPALAGTATTVLQRDGGRWKIRAQVFSEGPLEAGAALLRQGAPVSAARTQPGAVPAALRSLSCAAFEWTPWQGITDRGGIVVPVELNGRSYPFELDTGADQTVVSSAEAAGQGWARQANGRVRVERVRIAGVEIGAARIGTREQRAGAAGAPVGTLGLDLLMGRMVVIDYPGQRVCLVPSADAPTDLTDQVEWTPAEIRNGKLFVAAKVGERSLEGLFFSTGGAGALPLAVDQATWATLTGRAGERDATSRVTPPSRGTLQPFVGAPAQGALVLGGIRMESPLVYYPGAEPARFRGLGYPAAGVLGNALFWDRIVVLSLGVWPALGVLK